MLKLQNTLLSSSKTIYKLTKLYIRSITGIVFASISIAAILIGEYTYLIFIMFVCSTALFEFYNIIRKNSKYVSPILGIINALLIIILAYSYIKTNSNLILLLCFSPIVLIPIISFIISKNKIILSSVNTLLGLIYIVVPSVLSLSLLFEEGTYKPILLLEVLVLIWVFDIMAYVTGSLLGKTKMVPKISPKKTWEGFAGGVVFTIAASFLIWKHIPTLSLLNHFLIAVTVVIFATPGDLLESYFKRKANIKDSGNILPGHGGILDRFDSFFMVIPFVWVVLKIVG